MASSPLLFEDELPPSTDYEYHTASSDDFAPPSSSQHSEDNAPVIFVDDDSHVPLLYRTSAQIARNADKLLKELMRPPTDEDLIQLAVAWTRTSWHFENETFAPYHMVTGVPNRDVPSTSYAEIKVAASAYLHCLVHRRALFDTIDLPKLKKIAVRQDISHEERVMQCYFLRHHSPVALRPRGPVSDAQGNVVSFRYGWEHEVPNDPAFYKMWDVLLEGLEISKDRCKTCSVE